VGTSFCSPTNNSTGVPALLTGSAGSGVGSNLHLEVSQGVPNNIGYFLVGNENLASIPISNGLLCLTGTTAARVYRFNVVGGGANSVGFFDASGVLQNLSRTSTVRSGFDVPSTIPDSVPISIMSGDTWCALTGRGLLMEGIPKGPFWWRGGEEQRAEGRACC
jgi:hypothetical protein